MAVKTRIAHPSVEKRRAQGNEARDQIDCRLYAPAVTFDSGI